jgi:entry exclusion lipoprotein TrbK
MIGRLTIAAGLTAVVLAGIPAKAATPEQKQETCNFGADDKKLAGAARKSFLAKCMSDRDSPRGKSVAKPAPKQQQ